jgi:elongation factor G
VGGLSVLAASRIHSAVLLGHSGVGKTTLAEATLHSAGLIPRKGRVEDGSTTLGGEPEEIRHHASLVLGVATFDYRGHRIHLFDTPGLPDFFAEAELALPVADIAVFVISAVDGVQVQTERLWSLAAKNGVPRMIFINKLDAERADFERTLDQCRELCGSGIAPLELPLYEEGRFVGVADLLTDEATVYHEGKPEKEAIPDDIAELEHRVHANLVEGIVVADDELMERYLDGEIPTALELEETLARGISSGTVFPVLCGSAGEEVAIDRLLEFVCEVASHRSVTARAGDGEVEVPPDANAQPIARVVKTTIDPFVGRIALLQVCSGTLRPDLVLVNSRTRTEERLHALSHLQGRNSLATTEGVAGDMIAIAKVGDALPGDTFAPKGFPVELTRPTTPEPALSIAIRPHAAGDEDKLMTALRRLQEEDLALGVHRDDETHQTVLSGLGELHLQVVVERLTRKFGVEVQRDEVKLPFRETVSATAEAEGRHKKQSGGHGQFGVAHVRIEPLERGAGFVFEDRIVGGAIPRQFIPAVEKGIRHAMAVGGEYGFPVVDVRVILDDGKFHPVDSSEASFEQAGALAFHNALHAAGPLPLEPVSRLSVTVPARFLGDVLGDLNARRARVVSTEVEDDGAQVVVALVPAVEIGRYGTDLRALAGGYGSFHVEHDHYDVAPAQVIEHFARPKVLTS